MLVDGYEHPRGDLEPAFRPVLYQLASAGDVGAIQFADRVWRKPIDLTNAEKVYLIWRQAPRQPAIALKVEATILTPRTNGQVEHIWQPTDVPAIVAGVYLLQAEIRWGGDRPQTVPTKGRGFRFVTTADVG